METTPFIEAVKRMEMRNRRCTAYVIVDPVQPGVNNGRIVFNRSESNATMSVIAWLPSGNIIGDKHERHCKTVRGHGYNRFDACMAGAKFRNTKTMEVETLQDDGEHFETQLTRAGYLVIQAV